MFTFWTGAKCVGGHLKLWVSVYLYAKVLQYHLKRFIVIYITTSMNVIKRSLGLHCLSKRLQKHFSRRRKWATFVVNGALRVIFKCNIVIGITVKWQYFARPTSNVCSLEWNSRHLNWKKCWNSRSEYFNISIKVAGSFCTKAGSVW